MKTKTGLRSILLVSFVCVMTGVTTVDHGGLNERSAILLRINEFQVTREMFVEKREDQRFGVDEELLDGFVQAGLLFNASYSFNIPEKKSFIAKSKWAKQQLAIDFVKQQEFDETVPGVLHFDRVFVLNYFFIPARISYDKRDIIDKLKNKDWVRDRLDDYSLFFRRKYISRGTAPRILLDKITDLQLNDYLVFESETGLHVVQLFRVDEKKSDTEGFVESENLGWDNEWLNDALLESKLFINKKSLKRMVCQIGPVTDDINTDVVCRIGAKAFKKSDLLQRFNKSSFAIKKLVYDRSTRVNATVAMFLDEADPGLKVKDDFERWLQPDAFWNIDSVTVNDQVLNDMVLLSPDSSGILALSAYRTLSLRELDNQVAKLSPDSQIELCDVLNLEFFVKEILSEPYRADHIKFNDELIELYRISLRNKFHRDDAAESIAIIDGKKYSRDWLRKELFANPLFRSHHFCDFNYLLACSRKIILADYLSQKIKQARLVDELILAQQDARVSYELAIREMLDVINYNSPSGDNCSTDQLNRFILQELSQTRVFVDVEYLRSIGIDPARSKFAKFFFNISNIEYE